jgi:hypothetical protein
MNTMPVTASGDRATTPEQRAHPQHREREEEQQAAPGERMRDVRVNAPADDKPARHENCKSEAGRRELREEMPAQERRAGLYIERRSGGTAS